MKILIAYATTEGHTRKVARHLADRITDAGHSVELLCLKDAADINLDRFDGVILGASIHVGHYQRTLTDFAATNAARLSDMRSLLVSVSLSAAGHDTNDWNALDRISAEFAEATGWTPERTEHIAGAYTPSQYDLFQGFVMRRIIAKSDPTVDLDADREFTDWAAMDAVVDDWIKGD